MKRCLQSRFLKLLPGLLLRLSSVWLLASFASFYYGSNGIWFQVQALWWPALFFVVSLAFSLVLYYVGEEGPTVSPKPDN